MKLKSIYLVSMALLAGVFAACNDNDVENFDNQQRSHQAHSIGSARREAGRSWRLPCGRGRRRRS